MKKLCSKIVLFRDGVESPIFSCSSYTIFHIAKSPLIGFVMLEIDFLSPLLSNRANSTTLWRSGRLQFSSGIRLKFKMEYAVSNIWADQIPTPTQLQGSFEKFSTLFVDYLLLSPGSYQQFILSIYANIWFLFHVSLLRAYPQATYWTWSVKFPPNMYVGT